MATTRSTMSATASVTDPRAIRNQRPRPMPARSSMDTIWRLRLWLGVSVCSWIPPLCGVRMRRLILSAAGIEIGPRTTFGGRVSVESAVRPDRLLKIGSNCWINTGTSFELGASIRIGDRVSIAHDVALVTTSRQLEPASSRDGAVIARPVVIGDGCWLGARSTILPGVTVGAGSIVAAGAVVTGDVAPNSLVAGVPARLVRILP
jgi:maltose O-acetyltransferase